MPVDIKEVRTSAYRSPRSARTRAWGIGYREDGIESPPLCRRLYRPAEHPDIILLVKLNRLLIPMTSVVPYPKETARRRKRYGKILSSSPIVAGSVEQVSFGVGEEPNNNVASQLFTFRPIKIGSISANSWCAAFSGSPSFCRHIDGIQPSSAVNRFLRKTVPQSNVRTDHRCQ